MRGVVWGLTLKDAQNKLEEIEQEYELYHTANLICKFQTRWETRLEYDNGDNWRAVSASITAKGIRANVSYIDARIDSEIVNCIIKPCTIAGPYHAINYFYPNITEEELQ